MQEGPGHKSLGPSGTEYYQWSAFDASRERMETMRKIIGLSACIAALAIGGAARAQSAPDPVADQFVCDLTGDCGGAPGADAAVPTTTQDKSKARVSSTRGFSFNRAASGSAAAPTTVRQGQLAGVAPVRQPARVGITDLRLSFVSGSAILTGPARERLAKYAAALADPRLANRRVRIEGHTDATGNPRINQTLSKKRAQAVADYLVSEGLAAQRFEVVGYGASKPLPNVAPQAAENRRVMAVLL